MNEFLGELTFKSKDSSECITIIKNQIDKNQTSRIDESIQSFSIVEIKKIEKPVKKFKAFSLKQKT
jgi:hypothetical protein